MDKSLRAAIDESAKPPARPTSLLRFQAIATAWTIAWAPDNCVAFLNNIKAHAEDKGGSPSAWNILNSKVNHKDYMFDHIAWGVDVMKRVNSPRVKILFDIYHAQIMDGDIVRNIRDNFQWIAHFHTGGNPGRHDIDETQELNYRFIAQAIVDLKFTGFLSHEYTPAPGHDPVAHAQQSSRNLRCLDFDNRVPCGRGSGLQCARPYAGRKGWTHSA